MDLDSIVLIDLGTVSGNTQGCHGPAIEGSTEIFLYEEVYGSLPDGFRSDARDLLHNL